MASSACPSAISHQNVRLGPGRHPRPGKIVCVMELASMLAGERFGDRPPSVCPVIGAILRVYNDNVDDDRRQDLYRSAADAVDTRRDYAVQRLRADAALDWAVARYERRGGNHSLAARSRGPARRDRVLRRGRARRPPRIAPRSLVGRGARRDHRTARRADRTRPAGGASPRCRYVAHRRPARTCRGVDRARQRLPRVRPRRRARVRRGGAARTGPGAVRPAHARCQ